MAIWQYTFYVLPKRSIEVFSLGYQSKKNIDDFDAEYYWQINPTNKKIFYPIQEFLPKNDSWCNEIDLYGTQDSNCFEVVWSSSGHVVDVSFKIDFRHSYENILIEIIDFCILHELILLDESINFVPCNHEYTKKVIENSTKIKIYRRLSMMDEDY